MSKESCSVPLPICDEHQKHVIDQLRILQEKVFGNGTPGLLSDMRSLEQRIRHVEETSADNNRRLIKIEKALWGAMGGLGALQILLKFIKI